MSKIIEVLNSMDSLRAGDGSQQPDAGSGQDDFFLASELRQPVPRKGKSVLSRAAGWSLVVLLLTGSGVAIDNMLPAANFDASIFGTSTAAEPSRNQGMVAITSSPAKVGVLINDQFVGSTPIKFAWQPGIHKLVLQQSGYHDVVTMVNVKSGHTQELDLSLFPKSNSVATSTAGAGNKNADSPTTDKLDTEGSQLDMVAEQRSQPQVLPVSDTVAVPQPQVDRVVSRRLSRNKVAPASSIPPALAFIKGDNLLSSAATKAGGELSAEEFGFKYAIQVGAFLDRDSAVAYAVSWKKKGYDAYILELWGVKDPDRLWQSVRIGHFNDIKQARASLEAFKTHEKTDSYLASWDSFAAPEDAGHGAPTQVLANKAGKVTAKTSTATLVRQEQESKKFLTKLVEQKRMAEQASEKRLADLAEQKRLAEQASKKRLADLAEQKRQAEIASRQRMAELTAKKAEQIRVAKQERQQRLEKLAAQHAEQMRLAEVAEEKRLTELLEQQRLAALAEEQRMQQLIAEQRQVELAEKKRLAAIAEKKKLAEIAENRRLAELAKQARLAKIAEEKRLAKLVQERELAELAKQKRSAELAARKRRTERAEKIRLAKIAETKRLAAIAETKRQAELAEQQRLAQITEEQRQAELAENLRLAKIVEEKRQAELVERKRLAKLVEQERQEKLAEEKRLAKLEQQRKLAMQTEERRLQQLAAGKQRAMAAEKKRQAEEVTQVRLAKLAAAAKKQESAKAGLKLDGKLDSQPGSGLRANGKAAAKSPGMLLDSDHRKAEELFVKAGKLREEGKIDRAVDQLQQALRLNPEHSRARRRLARIYVEGGKVRQALELLRAAVSGRNATQLTAEDPNLSAFLAALYQREEEHWQAIDLYENLLSRYPDKGVWQMGLAISLERVNEPADALQAYTLALNSGDLSRKLQVFVKKRVRELQ